MSVAGQDTYPEDRADLGTIKYMGGMLQNATPYTVYVQNRLSRIYEVTGPATSLGIGDDATFTWESDGYGEFFCYVDSEWRRWLGHLLCGSCGCCGCCCALAQTLCASLMAPSLPYNSCCLLPPPLPPPPRLGLLLPCTWPHCTALTPALPPPAGKRVYNLVDKSHCESPITLKLKDTANHTLEVVMVDVCRKAIKKTILFGAWGWSLNTTGEPPEPPPAAEPPAIEPAMMKQFNYTKRNAADMPAAQLLAYWLSALLVLLGLLA